MQLSITEQRGVISNRARAKQIIDFSGLRYNSITPTDMDGLIEYNNKCYIGFEAKLEGVELPYGQRLALERATDDWQRAKKPALFIIAEHKVIDPEQDIDAANTMVREFRWNFKWTTPHKAIRTKDLIDRFLLNFPTGGTLPSSGVT